MLDIQFVREVGQYLGGWKAVKGEHSFTLTDPLNPGAELVLRARWNDAGRVVVSGAFPKGAHGEWWAKQYRDAWKNEITCAIARGAATVARDIKTRLLPEYHQRLEAWQDELVVTNQVKAERDAALCRVAIMLGHDPDLMGGHHSHESTRFNHENRFDDGGGGYLSLEQKYQLNSHEQRAALELNNAGHDTWDISMTGLMPESRARVAKVMLEVFSERPEVRFNFGLDASSYGSRFRTAYDDRIQIMGFTESDVMGLIAYLVPEFRRYAEITEMEKAAA